MAALWGEQVGRFERAAPGFQGGVLLREGVCLLAVSCWDGRPSAEAAAPRPTATDAYVVLLSRLDRRSWRVRIVDRGGGAVARNEWFEDGEDARRRWEALAGDAARLDAAGFRSRYRLP